MQQLPNTPVTDQPKREDNSNVSAVSANLVNKKKLTKRELLELADFLYSRYQYKKSLNKVPKQSIIKDVKHDKNSK